MPKFVSDLLARANLMVDGMVYFNNTATGQTPAPNDNSTKLATTAWVRTFVQPYTLPIATASVLGGIKVGSGLSIDAITGVLSASSSGGNVNYKTIQEFIATAGQTVFTISGGYTVGLIDVFLNGIYLSPNQTTATNGTTVILGTAAAVDDVVTVFLYSLYNLGTSAYARNVDTLTATAGQTTFSTNYIPGQIDVYYNGSKLTAAEFTATSGTAIVLGQAALSGDIIEVVTYLAGAGLNSNRTLTINGVTFDLTANRTWTLTTANISEVTNLYYTDARARAAISLTTTGTSGAASYNSTTGVLNIPQYQGVLTNPVTGTGTTNTLPKFTAASTIGNSNITDDGSLITLGSNSYVNGNLGVGVTPTFKLQVFNASAGQIARFHSGGSDARFSANSGVFDINTTGSAFTISTSSVERMRVFTDGNVGIATGATNAGFKLDVNGTARISGVLTLSSTISNGTYTYTLPSATGTLALTSNLSDYLPLTGGTLTGALSGTSATFSGGATFGSTVRPITNFAADLGTSTFRWAEIFGYSINLTNNATISGTLGVTGAATFSSSVTATQFISNITNGYGLVLNRTAVTTYNGLSLQTAGTAKWFLGMRENLSSNNYIIYSEQIATDVLKLDVSTGAATFSGALSGTSATFSGNLNLQAGAVRNINFYDSSNTNINAQIQYDQISSNSGQLFFGTNNAGTFATRLTIANTGAATFSSSVTASGSITVINGVYTLPALTPSYFGYGGYGVLIVGNTNSAQPRSIAFGVDVSGNSSGAFSGYGNEYIWRNAGSFITPNAANTAYNTLFSWNNNGQVTINGSTTLQGAVRINNGTGGTSPILTFGTETEATPGFKGIYLEGYWMYTQVHYNEGLRIRAVNGVGGSQTIATFSGASGNFSTLGSITSTTAFFNVNASSTITLTSAGTNASMIKAGSGDELYLGGNDTWQMRLSGGNVLMDNGGYVYLGKSWNATNHRINLEVAQGNNILVVSAYAGASNDSVLIKAASGANPNAALSVMEVTTNSATGRSISAGGTINASGNDYAEYMLKGITDNISKGDIVGIDNEGLLTNIFSDAVSFVVKSTNPSYVGGDAWGNIVGKRPERTTDQTEEYFAPILAEFEAKLEVERQKVDRIAFSGQVPCNVYEASVGDYIIPIETLDGKITGQAVTNPTFEQYQISVGKVWKIMEDGRAWIAVKIG